MLSNMESTVECLYNGHLEDEFTGRCREVSIRVNCMDRHIVGMNNPGHCTYSIGGKITVKTSPKETTFGLRNQGF